MSNFPWIVTLDDGKYTMQCKRCQASYTPKLPVPLNMYNAMIGEFLKAHKGCREQAIAQIDQTVKP